MEPAQTVTDLATLLCQWPQRSRLLSKKVQIDFGPQNSIETLVPQRAESYHLVMNRTKRDPAQRDGRNFLVLARWCPAGTMKESDVLGKFVIVSRFPSYSLPEATSDSHRDMCQAPKGST